MTPPLTAPLQRYVPRLRTPAWLLDREQIDYLVVTHDEPELTSLLQESFPSSRTAFLCYPQDRWDFTDEDQVDAMRWALRELPARHLLLAAHSHGPLPGDWRSPARWQGRRPRPWKGRRAQLEAHFSQQFEFLLAVCSEADRDEPIRVEGALYRGELEAFAAYDPRVGGFRCLDSGEVTR